MQTLRKLPNPTPMTTANRTHSCANIIQLPSGTPSQVKSACQGQALRNRPVLCLLLLLTSIRGVALVEYRNKPTT